MCLYGYRRKRRKLWSTGIWPLRNRILKIVQWFRRQVLLQCMGIYVHLSIVWKHRVCSIDELNATLKMDVFEPASILDVFLTTFLVRIGFWIGQDLSNVPSFINKDNTLITNANIFTPKAFSGERKPSGAWVIPSSSVGNNKNWCQEFCASGSDVSIISSAWCLLHKRRLVSNSKSTIL